MSYLGNSPTTQGFTPAVDVFSGNGSTTAFTLSRPVASVAQVEAVIENVVQSPVDAFTVSGNTITFTSAPPSGSSNIYVKYTSPITQVMQPTDGSVGTNQLAANAVTAAKVASGQVFALNGVAFPATQVPSADANTLDDYEEGTFTPTITASVTNPTVTFVDNVGTYVKVGQIVYFSMHISAASFSGGSGLINFGGLPFSASAGVGAAGYAAISVGYTANFQAGKGPTNALVFTNSTNLRAYYAPTLGATKTDIAVGDVGTFEIYFAGCYRANA